jgi:Ca2+-binding RTX toxin-like protein
LIGGAGDDTYVVNGTGVVIVENANEGTDTVLSAITYTLGANLENLTLTGTSAIDGTGNALDNVITGNSAANVLSGLDGDDTLNGKGAADQLFGGNGTDLLFGNGGADTLDGGAGADTMSGGTGNDLYIVDHTGDVIIENSGEGTDSVQASVSYTLSANVENLTLTGTSAIDGTGNDGDNVITGNSAVNHLFGGLGNDTLDGGAGADTMSGGLGDDLYKVDSTSDVIVENANEGTDTIQASVTYTLSDNVENLTLTGSSAINGTGNTMDNVLTGNSGANVLTALDGNDIVFGGGGKDTIVGGAGNDTLYGQGGADTLTGGLGADTFVFQSATAFSASDTITDFNAAQGDRIDLKDVLSGYDPLTMNLSDFVHETVSGGNTIISVDRDGAGTGYGFTNIATLTGITNLPDVDTLVANGNLLVH